MSFSSHLIILLHLGHFPKIILMLLQHHQALPSFLHRPLRFHPTQILSYNETQLTFQHQNADSLGLLNVGVSQICS